MSEPKETLGKACTVHLDVRLHMAFVAQHGWMIQQHKKLFSCIIALIFQCKFNNPFFGEINVDFGFFSPASSFLDEVRCCSGQS